MLQFHKLNRGLKKIHLHSKSHTSIQKSLNHNQIFFKRRRSRKNPRYAYLRIVSRFRPYSCHQILLELKKVFSLFSVLCKREASSKMSRMCCYWLCCWSENRATPDSPGGSGGSAVVDEGGGGLSLASAGSAILSLVIIAVAVSTGQWLLTEEKMPKFPANRHSHQANASDEPVKYTYSGLWKVCVTKGEFDAVKLFYFF